MKPRHLPLSVLLVGVAALLAAAPARAEDGFYAGVAANVLTLEGDGTWAGEDFDITAALPSEELGTIGLNWSEKLLFGLKPAVGYRFGSGLAVEAAVTGSVPINSFQAASTTQGGIEYTQSADIDWSQQSVELVAKYYVPGDWHVYGYGGVQYIRIAVDAVAAEGVTQYLTNGQVIENTDTTQFSEDMSTIGGVVGVGIEFPSENMNLTAYGAIQYSLAEVDSDTFVFDTEDFSCDVGGFSALFGLKMHLFGD